MWKVIIPFWCAQCVRAQFARVSPIVIGRSNDQIPDSELARTAGAGQGSARDVLAKAVARYIKQMPAAEVVKLDPHSQTVVAAYKNETMLRSAPLVSAMHKVLS